MYAAEDNRFIMLRPGRVEVDMRGYPTEKMGYNGKIHIIREVSDDLKSMRKSGFY